MNLTMLKYLKTQQNQISADVLVKK